MQVYYNSSVHYRDSFDIGRHLILVENKRDGTGVFHHVTDNCFGNHSPMTKAVETIEKFSNLLQETSKGTWVKGVGPFPTH